MLRKPQTPRSVRPVNFKPLFESTPRSMRVHQQPESLDDMLPPLTPGVITIDSSCSESPTRGPSPTESAQAHNDQRPLSTEPVLQAPSRKKYVKPSTIPETPRWAKPTKCWASRLNPSPKPTEPKKKKKLRLTDEDRKAVWKRLWGEGHTAGPS